MTPPAIPDAAVDADIAAFDKAYHLNGRPFREARRAGLAAALPLLYPSDKEVDAARELFVRTSNRVDQLRTRIEAAIEKWDGKLHPASETGMWWERIRADLKRALEP